MIIIQQKLYYAHCLIDLPLHTHQYMQFGTHSQPQLSTDTDILPNKNAHARAVTPPEAIAANINPDSDFSEYRAKYVPHGELSFLQKWAVSALNKLFCVPSLQL